MESSPSSSDVRNTRLLFSAGEESLSAKIDAAEASYAHVPEISAGDVQRYDVTVSGRNIGVTRLMDPENDDKVQYESSFEILTEGSATLGELADRFGQIRDNVIRVHV